MRLDLAQFPAPTETSSQRLSARFVSWLRTTIIHLGITLPSAEYPFRTPAACRRRRGCVIAPSAIYLYVRHPTRCHRMSRSN